MVCICPLNWWLLYLKVINNPKLILKRPMFLRWALWLFKWYFKKSWIKFMTMKISKSTSIRSSKKLAWSKTISVKTLPKSSLQCSKLKSQTEPILLNFLITLISLWQDVAKIWLDRTTTNETWSIHEETEPLRKSI